MFFCYACDGLSAEAVGRRHRGVFTDSTTCKYSRDVKFSHTHTHTITRTHTFRHALSRLQCLESRNVMTVSHARQCRRARKHKVCLRCGAACCSEPQRVALQSHDVALLDFQVGLGWFETNARIHWKQFKMHFIELFFVETNQLFSSKPKSTWMWAT